MANSTAFINYSALQSEFSKTRTAYGAPDIRVFLFLERKSYSPLFDGVDQTIGNTAPVLSKAIALPQTRGITWTIATPVNVQTTFGTTLPFLAVTKGIPSVSGSIVFAMYDEHPVLGQLWSMAEEEYKDLVKDIQWGGAQFAAYATEQIGSVNYIEQARALAWAVQESRLSIQYKTLSDLPSSQLWLQFANRTGMASSMGFLSLTFINEAGSLSTDNPVSDIAATFIAPKFQPLVRATSLRIAGVSDNVLDQMLNMKNTVSPLT